jgi:hypothetical protein
MVVPEVPARLVAASVFKTAVPCDKRAAGGFDSHALPLALLENPVADRLFCSNLWSCKALHRRTANQCGPMRARAAPDCAPLKLRGINFCVDLSATPYFLGRVGQDTNRPFPWVASDFGLVEAIESGLTKIPQLAIRDTSGAEIPGASRSALR